jgi:hypothetical protein
MNDTELRRALERLRIPPPAQTARDDALFAARQALRSRTTAQSRGARHRECWTWRDWLWPSPLVWAVFVVLWGATFGRAGLALLSTDSHPLAEQSTREEIAPIEPLGSLARGSFALHQQRLGGTYAHRPQIHPQ